MREIKFRFWNGKEMDMSPETHTGWLNDNFSPDMEGECVDWAYLQFTGLKDKNGVEIYEGDIVKGQRITKAWGKRPEKTDYLIFEVYWDEEWRGFKVNFPKMKWSAYLGTDMPYEVIGNIYQNPELLK